MDGRVWIREDHPQLAWGMTEYDDSWCWNWGWWRDYFIWTYIDDEEIIVH